MRTIEQQTAEASTLLGSELVKRGEEMLTLGRSLLSQAKALDKLVDRPSPEPPEPESELEDPAAIRPEESNGTFGKVTFGIAKARAEEMGEFTHVEYAVRLGLKPAETMRWLTRLIERDVLKYHAGRFQCVSAPSMRNWVVHQTDPFTVVDAAKATKLTETEATGQLDALLTRKIVRRINGSGMYQYVSPDPRSSPRSHPHRTPVEREAVTRAPERGAPVRRAAAARVDPSQRSRSGAGGVKGFKQKDRRYEKAEEIRKAKQATRRKRTT